MQLKRYEKKDCMAVWSNSKAHGELLACASTNSANNSLFDLELLSVDLADPSKNLQVQGKGLYNSQFSCLAWGTFGQKQGTLPYGLIFGGTENGGFTIWNPAEMIGVLDDVEPAHIEEQSSLACIDQADQQGGYPITCAEWNALKNNFLAYGSYSSLLILDVAKNISQPQIMQASSTNPHQGTYVTSVSWNKEVPHILASAGGDGLVALYDIKTNKSIFKIKDNFSNNHSRQVKIAWSKHISTHIAVTLDDEKKNQLQIWDLRNQKGPIVVIDRGHNKGIHTMDWSEIDNDLILMSSRDNIVNCWNIKENDQPMNSRRSDAGVLEVSWAKNLPSVYSISTVNGLSVYSLDDKNIHSYIPKWLKVPANSVFNGNQNLITFSQERGNTLVQYTVKKQISKQLAEQIAVLEQFMENQSVEALKDAEGHTGQFWKLIAAKVNQDGDSDIYEFLNLNKQKIIKEVQQYTGKKRDSSSVNNLKSSKKQKQKTSRPDYIPVPVGQAADFFGTLSSEPLQESFNNKDDENQTQNIKYDMVPRNFNWDIGKEKLIKQNMLIGNYEGAIDAAIKCGRAAQALIIAYSVDQSMFNNTLKTFFTQTTDKFISGILKHIAFKDTQELVKKYDLDKWKQCIALIFSLSSSEKRKNLLCLLAGRLQQEQPHSKQHQQASIYCLILAQKFQKIVQVYEKRLNSQKASLKQKKLNLVIYATRLLAIYTGLTVSVRISVGFERIIRQVALLCIELGKKMLGYSILTKYAPHSSSKYINYIIHNTQELNAYRNSQNPIISLPVMPAKKQQKAKKAGRPAQTTDEVPTSIKPVRQPKLPAKGIPFQEEAEPETQRKKGPGLPPPPPVHTPKAPTGYNPQKVTGIQPPAVVPIVPEVKSKTPPPPPPPPSKKTQHQEQQDQSDDQTPQYQQPVKKSNVLPPPPPPKAVTRTQHVQEDHNPRNPPPPPPPSRHQPPVIKQQPPVHKNVLPPPPPPPSVHHATKQQVLPPSKSNIKSPPPPLPGRGAVQHRQVRQQQQQRYQAPQPVMKAKTPPPPPRGMQPPPRVAQQQQPQQHYEQQCQQQQRPPSQKYVQPVPPAVKKGNVPPPPPPAKTPVRVQSQKEEQEEAQTSFTQSQQGRRPPPPPPARKVVPPPPPGRR